MVLSEMKKALVAAIITFALSVSLSCEIQDVHAQHTADGKYYILATPITVISPSNATYYSDSLILNVTFKTCNGPAHTDMNYSLDGKDNFTVPLNAVFEPIYALRTYPNGTTETGISMFSQYVYTGELSLTELSEGEHNLVVYSQYTGNNVIGYDSKEVFFTVNVAQNENSQENIPLYVAPSPSPTINPTNLAPTPTLSPCVSFSNSPSPSSSPTPTTAEQPTATPSPIQTNQPLNNSSTSLPSEYILVVAAVLIAVSVTCIVLAARIRKYGLTTSLRKRVK
jgi:hypothetical protein